MFKDEYLLDFINTENLGQLCTYLQALDLTVKKPHENPSIGIVLCKEMNKAFVDIVVRNYDSPMGVATYKTKQDMPEELQKAWPDLDKRDERSVLQIVVNVYSHFIKYVLRSKAIIFLLLFHFLPLRKTNRPPHCGQTPCLIKLFALYCLS